jgi:GT2 family glycosyltransferase
MARRAALSRECCGSTSRAGGTTPRSPRRSGSSGSSARRWRSLTGGRRPPPKTARPSSSSPAIDVGTMVAVGSPTVVICTHDRRERLLATLGRLRALEFRPPIVVVDNASTDGTAAAVRARYPDVAVIELRRPLGAAARSARGRGGGHAAGRVQRRRLVVGSRGARAGGARIRDLPAARAACCADRGRARRAPGRNEPGDAREPARVRTGAARSTGARLLACGAVARRSAVLACGGFHPRYGFGGEEHLLAVDMAAAGWGLAYADQVVAHHEPASGPRGSRADDELRNRLWSTWLRRPLPSVFRVTIAIAVGERSGPRALLAGYGASRGS